MATEAGSIIGFAVAQALREDPERAHEALQRLADRVASLEANCLALQARLGQRAVDSLRSALPLEMEMPLLGLMRQEAALETRILDLQELLAAQEAGIVHG